MNFEIMGQITREEDGTGIPNLKIEAIGLDEAWNSEMKLGNEVTNQGGYYRITFPMERIVDKREHFGIYIMVFNEQHAMIHDGKPGTVFKAVTPHIVDLKFPKAMLEKKGKSPKDRLAEMMKFAKST